MPKPLEKDKEKPENPDQKTTETKSEIIIDVKSDKFTIDERKEIVDIVSDDVEYGEEIQEEYIAQKELDLLHYHSAPPSKLEGLNKKSWMADRNSGLARSAADSYQAVLLATCWNPDSINFTATRTNDIDNRTNQEKFTKWGMGKQEANAQPEVDGFIHNRVVVGESFFKIYRKVWEEWVDKRIPVKNKKGNTIKYEIKTEKVRFEKGIIENIADIDDILMPAYGKNIQELPFFIYILHLDGETVLDYLKRKVFVPRDVEAYKKKLYNHAFKEKERTLGETKLKELGITEGSISDLDIRRLSIDLYEWYGYYTKNGRTERFRMTVDVLNDEFLAGKPVRKINRSGKIPFAGGGLYREPGQIRSESLMKVGAQIVNGLNNVLNQKSDFQYFENCPDGWFKPAEGYTQAKYEREPGVLYPSDDPQNIKMNIGGRSMAWAESDIRIYFELYERITGAATYFNTTQLRNKTLGQDLLVDRQSETRFGLWVSRIQQDICEAVGMWFELYQDYPPKGLAERVLGEDGKKIFPNLSIDTLRGDTAVNMTPDTVAGSKQYRKQIQAQIYQVGQSMIWLNPQINPQGNWNLCADTMKELKDLSDNEVKRYLGEQPKGKFDEAELDNEWTKFMNGEDFDPPEGETTLAIQHMEGHQKQKDEKYQDLDEEYRPNFDSHFFKTMVNAMRFIKNVQRDQMANQLAATMAANNPNPPQPGQEPQPGQPAQPGASGAPAMPMPGADGQPPMQPGEIPQ